MKKYLVFLKWKKVRQLTIKIISKKKNGIPSAASWVTAPPNSSEITTKFT